MRLPIILLFLIVFTAIPLAANERPNIIFLFTDDQRDSTLGCAGHPVVQTPNIDALAREGVHFTNSFVNASVCWVSRATHLTGRVSRSFSNPSAPDKIKVEALDGIVPDQLRSAGYKVAFFGKWHLKFDTEFTPEDHYDEFEKVWRNPYFHTLPDGTKRHETMIIGDRAVDFIERQEGGQPFLLNLWFNASHAEDGDKRPGLGHFPWPKVTDGMYENQEMPLPRLNDPKIYDAQPSFLKESINRERFFWRWDTPEKYQINMRAYFRMLSGIDHVVGRVQDALKENGLAENTIIVYSADNGYYMGDRGFAGKWSHYEESLRVPLVIFDPRLEASKRGRKEERFAVNVDLPATFLDWAGADIPEHYDGRSLVPLMENQSDIEWREDYFCEHAPLAPLISWEGVRGQRYTYARYYDQDNFEFLFDLENDPDQLMNLANDSSASQVLQQMRKRTDEYVAKYGSPVAPIAERKGVVRNRNKKGQKK